MRHNASQESATAKFLLLVMSYPGQPSPTGAPAGAGGFPPPPSASQQQQQTGGPPGYSQFMMGSGAGPPYHHPHYGGGGSSPYNNSQEAFESKNFNSSNSYPAAYSNPPPTELFNNHPSPGGSISSGPGSPYLLGGRGGVPMRHPSPPTGSPAAGKTGNSWQQGGGYGGYNYNGFNGSGGGGSVRPGSTSPHVTTTPGGAGGSSIYPPLLPPPLVGNSEEAVSDNKSDPASDKEKQRYSPAPGPGGPPEKDVDVYHNGTDSRRANVMEHMMNVPAGDVPSELKAFSEHHHHHPSNAADKAFHSLQHHHEDPSKLDTFDNRSQHAQHVLAGGKSSPLHAGAGHGSEGDLYCHAGQVPPLAAIEGMQASQEAEFMSMQQHHTMQHHHSDGGKPKYLYF